MNGSMNEGLLQYAWQFKLFEMVHMTTVDGVPVEVIDVGQLNRDAGPDFFNAKIRIGETVWAGNVEVHILASDWYRHRHDSDERYDTVILHVVERSDLRVKRRNGDVIPQLELRLLDSLLSGYQLLQGSAAWVRCAPFCHSLDGSFLTYQMSRMVCHRFLRKTEEMRELLRQTNNDWRLLFYQSLLRSLGMHVNALPFELLAKATPLNGLAKVKDSLFCVEAILMGQAGLLEEECGDDYYLQLRKEYLYQRGKYGLQPIAGTLWKYARMRPANFPTLRIAQVAALIHGSEHLFSKVLERTSIDQMRRLFECQVSDYWQTHYRFGKESKRVGHQWNVQTVDLLIINACLPVLFAYGNINEREDLVDRAMSLLEQLPAEENHVTEGWRSLDISVENAYHSQALIELKREYCEKNKCLQCPIGHRVLSR